MRFTARATAGTRMAVVGPTRTLEEVGAPPRRSRNHGSGEEVPEVAAFVSSEVLP
jgi:hypothetical protein